MRCVRCGNDNPGTNRFCGMCGGTLLQEPATVTSVPSQAQSTTTASRSISAPGLPSQPSLSPVPSAPDPPTLSPSRAAVRDEVPTTNVPSFLGLNDPAPAPRRRGGLSIDPSAAPSSGNLEYLLEDEEPKRGGAGKFILLVVVLAVVGGFGYLRWKNQSLPWFSSTPSKPAPAAENSDAPDSSAPAPSPSSSTSNPASPSGIQPAPNSAAQPANDAPPSASGSTVSSHPTTPPGTTASTDSSDPSGSASPAPAAQPAPTKIASAETTDADAEAPAKSRTAPVVAASKPHAAIAPAPVRSDTVAEAQKYLYGKGARQDCDRGLRLLKPAANQANPKAMVEMGALYSAGLCTPHDLPTAYRWFALALRKEPDNQSVQSDLQKLWSEMTQPERQLAIKLSQ